MALDDTRLYEFIHGRREQLYRSAFAQQPHLGRGTGLAPSIKVRSSGGGPPVPMSPRSVPSN